MSDFFADYKPASRSQREWKGGPRPPWIGPPGHALPGVVPIELVLAETEQVAVCVTRLTAYPSGFGFELYVATSTGVGEAESDPLFFRYPHTGRRKEEQHPVRPPELLRYGVEFADGGKATNLDGYIRSTEMPEPPSFTSTHERTGYNFQGWVEQQWIWPLPPPGPLAFVCEWPAHGIPVSRAEIDAKLVIDAAERARPLFVEE